MERFDDDRRTVVPRWRSLVDTPRYELSGASLKKQTPRRSYKHLMDAVIAEWESTPNTISALEVLDMVSLLGPDPRAENALQHLERNIGELRPQMVARIRKRVLQPSFIQEQPEIRSEIRRLKSQLRDQPLNSLGRVEISRLYAMAGQVQAASKHMEIALKISPNDRYILRSACRLFVHNDEPSKGMYFIQKSDAVKVDPWIMAAEVACADIVGRAPKWGIRELKAIAGTNRLSIHFSELASALGAMEEENGSHKVARKLIKRSLDQPTENALAQAAWMSTKAKREYVSLSDPYNEKAYEAGLIQAVHVKDYERADRFAWAWLNDEPFSSSPAVNGSYIASVFTRSYSRALAFAERGLLSNPDDHTLKNNQVYALIMLGRIEEAEKLLPSPGNKPDENRDVLYNIALHGLFHFKMGHISKGRQYYSKAADIASKRHPTLYASVISHWLENEVVARQVSSEEFEQITRLMDEKVVTSTHDKLVWSSVKTFLESQFKTASPIRSITTKRGDTIKYLIK